MSELQPAKVEGEFLSDEWFESLRALVAEAPAPEQPFRLGVVVTAVPGRGEISYTLSFSGTYMTGLSVGSVDDADVVIVESYEDARSLGSGDVTAAQLLEEGRIKLRGDVRRLVAAADTLAAVGARLS